MRAFTGMVADDAEVMPIPEPVEALRMTADAQKRMLAAALEREAEYRQALQNIAAMAKTAGVKAIEREAVNAL